MIVCVGTATDGVVVVVGGGGGGSPRVHLENVAVVVPATFGRVR